MLASSGIRSKAFMLGNGTNWSRLLAAAASVCPTQIKLLKEAKALAVEYSDGEVVTIPAELLRVSSPGANSIKGDQKALAGRRHVGIMGVEAVGNYAVRLQFDDLHGSGLFTWEALRDLGTNQEQHMQEYLQLLQDNGLSRDPIRSRK